MNINAVFEALASIPRRQILIYLTGSPLTAGDIAARFNISKPALSKHLKILENAGLVKSDKQGQFIYYSLTEDNLVNTLHDFLADFCPIGRPMKQESIDNAEYKLLSNQESDNHDIARK